MPSNRSKPKLPPSDEPAHQWSFTAIGTQWWIGVYQPLPTDIFDTIQRLVAERIEIFDATYSRFRSDSWISAAGRRIGAHGLPADARPLFTLYRQLYDATNGAVTPLIGQLLSDAGYDADYSFTPGEPIAAPAWDDVLTVTTESLVVRQPFMLDVGAAGKGYLIDIIGRLLQANGVERYCVDGSGDMCSYGLDQPLRIGMERPGVADEAIGVVSLQNKALCASAPWRRQWAGYTHIMNPHTVAPVQDVQATWVVADSCLQADGLSTALFFTPPERLLRHFAFSYAVLSVDNRLTVAPDFPAELFTRQAAHA